MANSKDVVVTGVSTGIGWGTECLLQFVMQKPKLSCNPAKTCDPALAKSNFSDTQ